MPRLIPDAHIAWRFGSVQAAALLLIVTALQADLLPMLRPLLSDQAFLVATAALAVLVIVLRVLAQPSLDPLRGDPHPEQVSSAGYGEADPHEQLKQKAIEAMAMTLYQASKPSKPWDQVSPESQHRWRTVATAALDWNYPGLISGDFVGQQF